MKLIKKLTVFSRQYCRMALTISPTSSFRSSCRSAFKITLTIALTITLTIAFLLAIAPLQSNALNATSTSTLATNKRNLASTPLKLNQCYQLFKKNNPETSNTAIKENETTQTQINNKEFFDESYQPVYRFDKYSDEENRSFAGPVDLNLIKTKIESNLNYELIQQSLNREIKTKFIRVNDSAKYGELRFIFSDQVLIGADEFQLTPFNDTPYEVQKGRFISSSLTIDVANHSPQPLDLQIELRNGSATAMINLQIPPLTKMKTYSIPHSMWKIKKTRHTEKSIITIKSRTQKSNLDFTLGKNIFFIKDPRNPEIFDFLARSLRHSSKLFGYDNLATYKPISQQEANAIMYKMIENLFDPAVQAKAVEIVNNPVYLKYFLDTYGLKLKILNGKLGLTVTPGTKFGFFSASSIFRRNEIPIESGEFALEHGAYSHLYQVICFLYGMNQRQSIYIINYLNAIIQTPIAASLWSNWTVLMDGAGNTLPSEPRYWLRFEKIEN